MDFNTIFQKNNIFYLTEEKVNFSDIYVAARKKENRILTDEEVSILPYLKHYEWPLREKSTERFLTYISSKDNTLQILEIGCGNGWFSNKIATITQKNQVVGLDINSEELKQAARVFKKANLQFVYGDVFEIKSIFDQQFDVIVLNGTIQYFPEFKKLLTKLLSFLKPNGEIHIMDSPFYTKETTLAAKANTLSYYTAIGFPEMASHYFHHSYENIKYFKIMYCPPKHWFYKLLNRKDSPFYWVLYIND